MDTAIKLVSNWEYNIFTGYVHEKNTRHKLSNGSHLGLLIVLYIHWYLNSNVSLSGLEKCYEMG